MLANTLLHLHKAEIITLLYSGYMSPEYAMSGHFSVKSDVFSFGVLLLEIVSGKKNWGFYHPDHDRNLLGHVSRMSTDISFHMLKFS